MNFPVSWTNCTLSDIAELRNGGTPPKAITEYWNNGTIPFVTAADLTSLYVEAGRSFLSEEGVSSGKTVECKKGDLLIGTRTRVGQCSIAMQRMGASQDITRAKFKVPIVTEYICWFMRHVADYIAFYSQGTSIQGITRDTLTSVRIPLPPIDEQRRIVARIKELTRRAEEARKLAAEREAEMDTLLQALYSRMIEGVEWKPLKEVASLVRRAVKTKPDGRYEEMGIRSFGKGTFQKPVLTGKQIGNKRIYTIHEGDLVFNNVFAWEKAIAVAKAEDQGRVGSHRFITYVPHEGQATSEFLCHHFLGERGIEDIRAASPGSAGRNRTLGLKKLEKILVPVPEYDEQKRFAEIAKRRQFIQLETAGIEEELKAFHAALLAKAFRGEL